MRVSSFHWQPNEVSVKVFHEGLKSWSCCADVHKPVLDFDEFMNIPVRTQRFDLCKDPNNHMNVGMYRVKRPHRGSSKN